ncbi:MAG: polysaccharide biosynthesis protein [Deltaproteobacteria bacterium]|nr:polysaccharide biosynthesis protein [Deltaproteobacteria bacterium]
MLKRIAVGWNSIALVRFTLILGLDALAAAFAFQTAVLLRLDGNISADIRESLRQALPVLVACRLAAVLTARLHRWSFRMSGLHEAIRLVAATAAGTALFYAVFHGLSSRYLPRSIYALEFFLALSLFALVRFFPRIFLALWSDQVRRNAAGNQRTIVVGAGGAGDLLLRDLNRSKDHPYFVVGLVDDAPAKQGTSLHGRPVLGVIDDLPRLIARHRISMVLLAIPSLAPERIRHILALCASSRASFKIIPASFARLDQKVTAAMLHDLSPEDLLPRASVAFDPREIQAMVAGKRTLVTGAGGSIGGEICNQLAASGASRIVLVDMNENELYLSARRLQSEYPGIHVQAEVADIREFARLRRIAARYRPEYVFHAAAHKHVPLMEDAPEEAIKNNVFGTLNVAKVADEVRASHFVLISTDKAVNPTSVMGASKRLAEYVVRDLARQSGTRMTAVRFGNVLGSAGSVVPIFKQQIERGGPVTVTHPECTRYFMTIPEAVGLVLLAGLGGYGDLCILDMGEPIKIAELAHNLITMAGFIPGQEIEIRYTGLRPGEKLFEELLTEDEERTQVVRNRIKVARSPAPPRDLHVRLAELKKLAEGGDRRGIILALGSLIPTYRYTPGSEPERTPEGLSLAPVYELPLTGSEDSRPRA